MRDGFVRQHRTDTTLNSQQRTEGLDWIRLNVLVARSGTWSRRRADALIAEGRVSVNGRAACLGEKVRPALDTVEVDGRAVSLPEKHNTVLLNKPAGYLVSRGDPHHSRTVYDLLPKELHRLVPVGRLDLDTEGALLFTSDGVLAELLTHPRYRVPKVYRALVRGMPSPQALARLERGVDIGDSVTGPARARVIAEEHDMVWRGLTSGGAELELEIREGRKREVRRMCDAVGHPVLWLRRVRFAGLDLSGVSQGEWRHVDDDELAAMRLLAETRE